MLEGMSLTRVKVPEMTIDVPVILEQQRAEVSKDWAQLAQFKNLKRVRGELIHETSLSDE